MSDRRSQLVAGVVLACLAVGYLVAGWQLPLGTPADPGAGMFPRGVGSLLVLAAGGVVATAFLSHRDNPDEHHDKRAPLRRPQYLRLAALGSICAGYVILLPLLGLATTAAGAAYLIMLIGRTNRRIVGLVVAILLGIATQYLFVTVLNVPLPETPLGF